MRRLRWATDIHLDHLYEDDIEVYARRVLAAGLTADDAIVLTGDVSNSHRLVKHLEMLDAASPCHVYFVLGNHDYYGGSIVDVRAQMHALDSDGGPTWLSGEIVGLNDKTVLVGVDGWADARAGNPASLVALNDFWLIDDLADTLPLGSRARSARGSGDRNALHAKLRQIADVEAATLDRTLDLIFDGRATERIIVATHVPPWPEAAWYNGARSEPDWQTYFVCVAVGKVLERWADARPDMRFEVLCGHTHGAGVSQIRSNLRVRTGSAVYGAPAVQATWTIDEVFA